MKSCRKSVTINSALFNLLLFFPLNSIVYKMALWENSKGTELITLSDIHLDEISVTKTFKNRKDIIDLSKKLEAYCIFEDVGYYTGDNTKIQEALKATRRLAYWGEKIGWLLPDLLVKNINLQKASPLFDITSEAKNNGVLYENVEFRFFYCLALYGYPMLIHDIYTEAVNKYNEIISYKTNQDIDELCANWINEAYSIFSSLL